jgi:hypothetical protein
MNAAEITALATGIPAIIAAIAGLVTALRAKTSAQIANGIASHANNAINTHIVKQHDAFPIQPPTETK